MNVKILKEEKNILEIEIDNLTIAEILRVYLNNEQEVEFVAWRREHPSKPVILRVETKGKTPKKVIGNAISKIEKEVDKLVAEVKKS
ncbi:MAG: RpoL/Rpb11 RNA polymerase subunit family protein [Candidatus Pacearchaeota archaeon]